jgi:hypothetical protein
MARIPLSSFILSWSSKAPDGDKPQCYSNIQGLLVPSLGLALRGPAFSRSKSFLPILGCTAAQRRYGKRSHFCNGLSDWQVEGTIIGNA